MSVNVLTIENWVCEGSRQIMVWVDSETSLLRWWSRDGFCWLL